MLMYLIAGVALVAALVGGYAKIHHDGFEEGVGSIQPKLTACQGQVSEMGKQIQTQNQAVEALKTEGEKKQQESAQALKAAEGKAKVWQDNAKRVQTILVNRQPNGPKDCKTAWEEIRKP